MRDIVGGKMSGELSDKEYRKRVDSTKRFERTLADNGYLVMKFFFQIDKHEQKKRLETLLEDDTTSWRVSKHDLKQNKKYDEYLEAFDSFMYDTNLSNAPWYMIDAKERKWAELQILDIINQGNRYCAAQSGACCTYTAEYICAQEDPETFRGVSRQETDG